MKLHRQLACLTLLAVAGCATKPAPVQIAVSQAPPLVQLPPQSPPGGASANLVIPAALPDGSYPTPNRGLTEAASIWHLRVALNVAALGCRGSDAQALVSGYNAMLGSRKAMLASAEQALATQYDAKTATGRDAYDDAMTRLYNFFAQPPAHDQFCTDAAAIMAAEPGIAPAAYPAFATASLARLDAAFTDFYRAYDAWRRSRLPQTMTVAVTVPVAPAPTPAPARPTLTLDPSVFATP